MIAAARRAARAAGEHAGDGRCCGSSSDRSCCSTSARSWQTRGRPDLPGHLLRAVRVVVPGVAARAVRRRAVDRRGRRRRHDDRVAHADGHGDRLRRRRPTTSSCRRRTCTTTVRTSSSSSPPWRSTPCGRELSIDAWLAGPVRQAAAADVSAWVAALVAPLRGGGRVRGVRAQQARRSGLVRRHRHVAPRDARPRPAGGVRAAGLGDHRAHRPGVPHRRGEGDRGDRAVHRHRPLVAAHPVRRHLDRRVLPRGDPALRPRGGVLVPGDRRARDLGRPLDP